MKKELIKVLKNLNTEQWENLADGHTFFKPIFYHKMGFPEEFVAKFDKAHKSGGTYKSNIYKNDNDLSSLVDELVGVYNLDFLYGLCDAVKVSSDNPFIGRGFQARHLVEVLMNFAKNQ